MGLKNPPLDVTGPAVRARWEWVTVEYQARHRHRLSRVVTPAGGQRGDDILDDRNTTRIFGVTVCGYDGELWPPRDGPMHERELPECANCARYMKAASS